MASGMARSHRGLAGTLNPHPPATTRSPSAGVDILVRSAATRTSTRRLTRSPAASGERTSGSTAGPVTAPPVPDWLEASVPRPAGGAAAAASTACALAARPRRPPDPPVPAAATAGVLGANSRRSAGLEALGDPGGIAFGVDPGGALAGSPPFAVNQLQLFDLGRLLELMSFDMLVEDFTKFKIRVRRGRVSHKGSYGTPSWGALRPAGVCGSERAGPF